MLRNSNLSRRWWYVKKRNIKRIRMMLRLGLTALIMGVIYLFLQINIFEILGL